MFRLFGTIVLVVVFISPLTLEAQHRGGHGGGVVRTAPAPAFVGRGPAPAPVFVGRAPMPFVPVPVIRGPHFPIVRSQRTIIVPSYGFGGFGVYSPYVLPVAPALATVVGPTVYSEPAYVTNPAPQPPPISSNELELSYQVGRLSQEIEQLRQEQARRQAPPAPEPSAIPTVLVFRDGHRLEIVNYAVVGQTLWVLDEKTSTKISIADLDLDATQRENRGRGIRFPLPAR